MKEKFSAFEGPTTSILGIVLTILFASNVFFVKRLVDKLDATEQIVWDLRQQVAVLKRTIEDMTESHRDCFNKKINGKSEF